jgi:hypothetical protein
MNSTPYFLVNKRLQLRCKKNTAMAAKPNRLLGSMKYNGSEVQFILFKSSAYILKMRIEFYYQTRILNHCVGIDNLLP